MKDVLLIIAPKNFQLQEYRDTKAELEKAGLNVKVASLTSEDSVARDGTVVKPDYSIEDVKASDFSAIVVIGGTGATVLGDYYEVLHLLQDFERKGKIVAGICIAPTILAKAGVLEGKKATVWNGDREQSTVLEERGAIYEDKDVVRDGNIVTANGPSASKEFGQKLAEMLKEPRFD